MGGMSVSISSMNVSALSTAVSANNVANVNTDGYQAKRMDREELAQGGVKATQIVANTEPTAPEGSNVDLASEFTSLMIDAGTYKANLKVVQVQNELLGQTLDMKS